MSYRRRKCATDTNTVTDTDAKPIAGPTHRQAGRQQAVPRQVLWSEPGFPPYKTKGIGNGNATAAQRQRCTSSIFCKCIKYMYLIRVGQKRNQTISESEPKLSAGKACDRLLGRQQHFVSVCSCIAKLVKRKRNRYEYQSNS